MYILSSVSIHEIIDILRSTFFVIKISGQSGTINRYLASLVEKPGFYPADKAELAFCDMVHETAQELAVINPIVNVFKDDLFQQKKTDYFEVRILECWKSSYMLIKFLSFLTEYPATKDNRPEQAFGRQQILLWRYSNLL